MPIIKGFLDLFDTSPERDERKRLDKARRDLNTARHDLELLQAHVPMLEARIARIQRGLAENQRGSDSGDVPSVWTNDVRGASKPARFHSSFSFKRAAR